MRQAPQAAGLEARSWQVTGWAPPDSPRPDLPEPERLDSLRGLWADFAQAADFAQVAEIAPQMLIPALVTRQRR
jgi:hypothetical protein